MEWRNFSYGETHYAYRLQRQARTTISIAVLPDKSIVVKAPLAASEEAIQARVHKRARWILRQQSYFQQFAPRTTTRRYLSGETHLYLGRQYRLKVRQAPRQSVRLSGGFFQIQHPAPQPEQVKRLLEAWYRSHAQPLFRGVLAQLLYTHKHLGFTEPSLQIRRMKTRWGSMSPAGVLTLNLDLIRAPKSCIEYILFHELCHQLEPNHSAAFYKLLDTHMPDWPQRKHQLETRLA